MCAELGPSSGEEGGAEAKYEILDHPWLKPNGPFLMGHTLLRHIM